MAVNKPQRCKNIEGCSMLCENCEEYLRDTNAKTK